MAARICKFNLELDAEVNRVNKQINDAANDILSAIDALDLTAATASAQALLTTIDTTLKASGNSSLSSAEDLANLTGSPTGKKEDDLKRLNALGIASLNGVLYNTNDSNNIKNLRTLYQLTNSFSISKDCLSGKYGSFFIVTYIPTITKYVSPYPRHLTLAELSDLTSKKVFSDDILQVKEGLLFVTYYKRDEFIGIDTSLSNSAIQKGVSIEEISVKFFGLNSQINTFYVNKLKGLGLSSAQISAANDVDTFDIESVKANIESIITLTNKDPLTALDLQNIKSSLLSLVQELTFEFLLLDPLTITTLEVKNTDADIVDMLNARIVTGIDLTSTAESVNAALVPLQNIDPGSFTISNAVLSVQENSKTPVLITVLNALSNVENQSREDLITELLLAKQAANDYALTPTRADPARAYDSPSSLLNRNIDINKTYSIFDGINDVSTTGLSSSLTDNVLATQSLMSNSFQAAFKVTNALNTKTGDFLRILESSLSLGVSLNGGGSFGNSFIKCAFGFNVSFNFNPLAELLNKLTPDVDLALSAITTMINRILLEVMAKIACLMEMITPNVDSLLGGVCTIEQPNLGTALADFSFLLLPIVTLQSLLQRQTSSVSFISINLPNLRLSFDFKLNSSDCSLTEPLLPSFSPF